MKSTHVFISTNILLDDDFDAFFAVAHSASLVNVQVTVGSEAAVPESDIPPV